METIIITILLTCALMSLLWMIEYSERGRIIKLYENSYIENDIRYVREAKPGMTLPVQYAIWSLKDGKLKFIRDCR